MKRFLAVILGTLTLAGAGASSIAWASAASATPPNPAANYVFHTYEILLGRAPTAGDLTYWEGVLAQGPPFASSGGAEPTMLAVATDFVKSPEYLTDVVAKDYTTYLHRGPDAAGLAGWSAYLEAGGTDLHVEEAFLASPEYFSTRGSNNFDTWLAGDVRHRSLDPNAQTYWDAVHTAGATTLTIATGIVTSPEAQGDVIGNLYLSLLGRSASATDTAYWTTQMATGATNESITALIVASPEFYADSQIA